MRKRMFLILLLLILIGCSQEYPGNFRLVCESKRGTLGDREHFSEEFAKDWNQHSIFYAKDNYITSSENKIEFLITDQALNFLEEKLNGDKEALKDKFLDSFMYNNFQFVEDADKVEFEYFEDRILMHIKDVYDERPKGWQGIIIPSEMKLSEHIKTMKEIEDHCEVIKD